MISPLSLAQRNCVRGVGLKAWYHLECSWALKAPQIFCHPESCPPDNRRQAQDRDRARGRFRDAGTGFGKPMIALPSNTRVCLAVGNTDLRKPFHDLRHIFGKIPYARGESDFAVILPRRLTPEPLTKSLRAIGLYPGDVFAGLRFLAHKLSVEVHFVVAPFGGRILFRGKALH